MKGIDVYTLDGVIDWEKVAADKVGFAMVKATQGYLVSNPKSGMITDSKFKKNIEGASEHGLQVGAYHYLMAKTVDDAKKEAAYFIKAIMPYKDRIDLYAAVDIENDKAKRYSTSEKKLNTDILLAFCAEVEKAGFASMIYINPNFIKNYLEFDRLADKNIWLAYYTDERTARGYIEKFKDPDAFKIWQYGKATVKGIAKDVDGDILLQEEIKRGDHVKITGDRYYNGAPIPERVKAIVWIVDSVVNDRAVLGRSVDGKHTLNSAVDVNDLRKV